MEPPQQPPSLPILQTPNPRKRTRSKKNPNPLHLSQFRRFPKNRTDSTHLQLQVVPLPAPRKRNTSPGLRIRGCRIYDSVNGRTCHQCRQKTMDMVVSCKNRGNENSCNKWFCFRCLLNRYGELAEELNQMEDWKCPKCRGICNCSFCMRDRGQEPYGMRLRAVRAAGGQLVSEILAIDNGCENVRPLRIQIPVRKKNASGEKDQTSSAGGKKKEIGDGKRMKETDGKIWMGEPSDDTLKEVMQRFFGKRKGEFKETRIKRKYKKACRNGEMDLNLEMNEENVNGMVDYEEIPLNNWIRELGGGAMKELKHKVLEKSKNELHGSRLKKTTKRRTKKARRESEMYLNSVVSEENLNGIVGCDEAPLNIVVNDENPNGSEGCNELPLNIIVTEDNINGIVPCDERPLNIVLNEEQLNGMVDCEQVRKVKGVRLKTIARSKRIRLKALARAKKCINTLDNRAQAEKRSETTQCSEIHLNVGNNEEDKISELVLVESNGTGKTNEANGTEKTNDWVVVQANEEDKTSKGVVTEVNAVEGTNAWGVSQANEEGKTSEGVVTEMNEAEETYDGVIATNEEDETNEWLVTTANEEEKTNEGMIMEANKEKTNEEMIMEVNKEENTDDRVAVGNKEETINDRLSTVDNVIKINGLMVTNEELNSNELLVAADEEEDAIVQMVGTEELPRIRPINLNQFSSTVKSEPDINELLVTSNKVANVNNKWVGGSEELAQMRQIKFNNFSSTEKFVNPMVSDTWIEERTKKVDLSSLAHLNLSESEKEEMIRLVNLNNRNLALREKEERDGLLNGSKKPLMIKKIKLNKLECARNSKKNQEKGLRFTNTAYSEGRTEFHPISVINPNAMGNDYTGNDYTTMYRMVDDGEAMPMMNQNQSKNMLLPWSYTNVFGIGALSKNNIEVPPRSLASSSNGIGENEERINGRNGQDQRKPNKSQGCKEAGLDLWKSREQNSVGQ